MNNPNVARRLTAASVFSIALALTQVATAADADEQNEGEQAAEAAEQTNALCMSLPRVSIGDGAAVVSQFSEYVREQVAVFVDGPLVETRAMSSRLPVQVRAEAKQEGCRYLLNLTFNHHPQSKIGKRSADAAVTVGSAASSLGALSNEATGALGAASTISGLFGNDDSGATSNSAYPVGKNDRLVLSYVIEPVGKQPPLAKGQDGKFEVKVTKDNEPAFEGLVEQAAGAIVESLVAEQEAR